jgi:hypothetical protein
MEMDTLTFGDIVSYSEQPYVFLCATTEIIYLAKIIDGNSEDGLALKNLCQKMIDTTKQPQAKQNTKNALFCFVTLVSENHKGDIAHLNDSQKQFNFQITKTMDRLDHDDIISLRDKILGEDIIPQQLKRLTTELNIT